MLLVILNLYGGTRKLTQMFTKRIIEHTLDF